MKVPISLAAEAHEEKRHNVQMMHSVLTFDPNHFMTGIKLKYWGGWGWGEEREEKGASFEWQQR